MYELRQTQARRCRCREADGGKTHQKYGESGRHISNEEARSEANAVRSPVNGTIYTPAQQRYHLGNIGG
jgi:hypothetical protein